MYDLKLIQAKVTQIANDELKSAREYRDETIKSFPGDGEMVDMFHNDFKEREKAVKFAKVGQFEKAFDTIVSMDTAARDAVTDKFYDTMKTLSELVKS